MIEQTHIRNRRNRRCLTTRQEFCVTPVSA